MRDGVLLALAALGVCWLLGQQSLRSDAHRFLLQVESGDLYHENHFLYLPALAAFDWLLSRAGMTLYQAAQLASMIPSALGILLVHASCRRLRLARGDALALTALVAASPPVVYFATLVEVHGFFFAFAGLSFLATAHLLATMSAAAAVLLGLAMAAAYCAHGTGALLPGVLGPTLLALAWQRGSLPDRGAWLRALGLLALAGIVLAAGIATAGATVRRAAPAGAHEGLGFLLYRAGLIENLPAALAGVTANEWLWPYLPLSVLWLIGFARRRARPLALAALLSLAVYLAAATALLGAPDSQIENGAYLLPLVWTVALVCRAALARWIVIAVACLCLGMGVRLIRTFDEAERSLEFQRGFEEVTAGQPALLLIGNYFDLEAFLVRLPRVPHLLVPRLAAVPEPTMPALLAQLDRTFEDHWRRAAGVYLTRDAETLLLEAAAMSPASRLLLEHLRNRYRLEPVAARGFAALRVARPL
jgi:hypothetical protein